MSARLPRLVSAATQVACKTAFLVACCAATSALAADLDSEYNIEDVPPPIAETKVEFGSGWYIRGDIGGSKIPALNIVSPAVPTAGNDFRPLPPTTTLKSGSDYGYVATLGAGYSFLNGFRADATFDFLKPIASNSTTGYGAVFCPTGVSYPNEVISATGAVNYGAPSYATGGCAGNYEAQLKRYAVLFNGYYDFAHWSRFTPYVGAGVGLSFGHYQTSATYTQSNGQAYQVTYNDPQFGSVYQNYDSNASGTYYNFAFALMAGVAIDVYPHTKLDLGYRYLHLGSINGVGGQMNEQELRAGLRYMIDN